MRFTTKPPEPVDTPVSVTLREHTDGHVALLANGIEVLWLTPDGRIMRNSLNDVRLKALGFQLNDGGRVALTTKES